MTSSLFGKISCDWNTGEQSCWQNKCVWNDDKCISYEAAGFKAYFSNEALKESIIRQRQFAIRSQLYELIPSISSTVAKYTESSDMNMEIAHLHEQNEMLSLSNLSLKSLSCRNEVTTVDLQTLGAYINLIPKTSNVDLIYRGIHIAKLGRESRCVVKARGTSETLTHDQIRRCLLERMEKPRSFISTSFDIGIAKKFASPGFLFKIHLPRGIPFLSVNGSIPNEFHTTESEIILPTHILDKHGHLKPIEFSVLKSGENLLERNTFFDAYIKNALEWDPDKESLFAYEQKYVLKVCSQISEHRLDLALLCAKSKALYNLPLNSAEHRSLELKGSFRNSCQECNIINQLMSCRCCSHGEQMNSTIDLHSCDSQTVYFDQKKSELMCE